MKIVFLLFSCILIYGGILSSQEPNFELAYNSRFTIDAQDAGIQTFEKKPKVYVTYLYKGRSLKKYARVVNDLINRDMQKVYIKYDTVIAN